MSERVNDYVDLLMLGGATELLYFRDMNSRSADDSVGDVFSRLAKPIVAHVCLVRAKFLDLKPPFRFPSFNSVYKIMN